MKKRLHMNMYVKILLLCTSSILAALLLLAALFAYSSAGTIYEQSKQTNIQLLQRLQDDIAAKVKDVESVLISVYNEEDLMNDLSMHLDYDRMKESHFRAAYGLAQNFSVEDGVVAIYFYDDFNRLISSYRHASTPMYQYPEDPLSDEADCNGAVLRRFLRSENTTMLISSYYNENRRTDMIRFAINIFSQDGSYNQIGAVVCDVDSGVFLEILEKYHTQQDNLLWLQPTGDRVAVSVGTASDAAAEMMAAILDGRTEGELETLVQGQVLFCLPLESGHLTLYSLMPPTLLVANQKALTVSLITIAVLMLMVFAFVSMLVARGITRPLAALTGTMRRIQSGQTQLRVENLGTDEIGELGLTFNQMLDRVEDLLAQEYEMKLSLQKARFNALQAQINPHFLYNTLDTMSSIAQIQGCDAVSDLSEALGGIFRYTLDMSGDASTVEKELIHLKNYISVMDVRMHSGVKYIFDIQESVLSCPIPRLTLQPLVENAILHGVRGVRHEKIIRVTIAREQGMLVVAVNDNGAGMDPTAINERLQRNDRTEIEKGRSIGLVNINARVRMLYGDACGVRVESEPGAGTTVRVYLPAKEEVKSRGV